MGDALATVTVGLLVAAGGLRLFVGWRDQRRRSTFEATLQRAHPELARTLAEHRAGELGQIAATAVDIETPGAPRQLGDQEVRW